MSLPTRADLLKVIREKKKNITDSTVSTYAYNIARVKRALGNNFSAAQLDVYLRGLENPPLATVLLASLSAIGLRFEKLMDEYTIKANDVLDRQRKSKTESKNWITEKDLKRMHRRMAEDVKTHRLFETGGETRSSFRALQAHIAFLILHELHFRNDLPTFKVARVLGDVETRGNWYVVSQGLFLLRNFKTKRSFQRRGIKLPLRLAISKRLKRKLRDFCSVKPESDFLFSDFSGKVQMSKSSFHTLITGASKRYLNVRLGTTQLRHLYISWFDKKSPTIVQRRTLARRMQQLSLETQLRYVRLDETE